MAKAGQADKKKSENKFMKLVKGNVKSILLVVALTLLNGAMLVFVMKEHELAIFSWRGLLALAILVVVTLIICGILYFAKKKAWKIEKIYLVCGILLGSIYCFLLPIGGAPDEPAHFIRAYEYAEGHFYTKGQTGSAYMPSNMRDVIVDNHVQGPGYQVLEKIGEKADTEYAMRWQTAEAYAVFNYMPQIVGVWIGKILQLPLIPMMWIARFVNMLFCVVMIYFCIKFIPVMKKMVFLIGLFPMTMQLFASTSADGSIICAGIGLVTYVLYARKTMTRQLNWKDFLLLLLMCLALTISKPVYVFLCPLLFWIPKERFKSTGQKVGFIFTLGIVTLVTLLVKASIVPLGEGLHTSTGNQFEYIFSHPLQYLWTVFVNAVVTPETYIKGAIGSPLEWSMTNIYAPHLITLFIFFVFLCAERETKLPLSLRAYALIAFVIMVAAVFTSMFVVWSAPNASVIDGVQGRYFLPILMLIPLVCLPSAGKLDKKELVKPDYLYITSTLTCLYAILVVFCNHI